ncbi:MAG: DUF4126 domain-containing protein [Silanimonas lenta]
MPDAPVFALGLALACLAGVRAYLTVLGTGIAALLGWLPASPETAVLTSPWVLGTAAALAAVEFAADKIPGVDSAWDLVNTLARIPVGAFLASAAFSPEGEWSLAAAVLGGTAALTTHALKSGSRVAINASPEPLSNWLASSAEDGLVLGGLALALVAPVLALGLILLALALGGWLGWRLLRRFTSRRQRKPLAPSQV